MHFWHTFIELADIAINNELGAFEARASWRLALGAAATNAVVNECSIARLK